jgi:uncharacterized protein (DUF2141 family)
MIFNMRILVLLVVLAFVSPASESQYRLEVNVSGLDPLKGDLYIAVHQRPEFFHIPDSSVIKKVVQVKSGNETITFTSLNAGQYAVAVYHDENLNGSLDTRGRGIPVEGYGFSNNPRIAGRPKFEHAAFELKRDTSINITLLYSKNRDKQE